MKHGHSGYLMRNLKTEKSDDHIGNFSYVSAVICTYNRRKTFEKCFDSLLNQTYPEDKYEIIVVDSSNDITDTLMKRYVDKAKNQGIKLEYTYQKPSGIAIARNCGIEKSNGKFICFIDDDCIASNDWIEKLVCGFDSENIGGVGGKINIYKPQNLIEKFGIKNDQESTIKKNSQLIGANCAYTKKVLQSIKGFDENMKYLEDFDIGIRVKLGGWILKYAPDAIVYHKHRASLKELLKQQYSHGFYLAMICKKYYLFSTRSNLIIYSRRLIISFIFIICYTLLLKKEYILKNLVNFLIFFSILSGFIKGIIFGKYEGPKIYRKKINSSI